MLSIGSTVGRLFLSFAGDYLGPLNVWLLTQTIITALFLLWPTCSSLAGLSIFAVAYGLMSGGFVSLYPLCISILMGSEKLPEKMGNVYMSFVFGTIAGAPIAGQLIDSHTVFAADGTRIETNWWPVAVYGCALTAVSLGFVVYLRMSAAGWRFARLV